MSAETKPVQTLDQRRAAHAWHRIISQATTSENGKRKYGEGAKEYAQEARKMPVRIITSGLGQALAFILAKAKDKKPNLRRLHQDLSDWVLKNCPMRVPKPGNLMESILEGDADFLRWATEETLAYLQWLNRFAEAEGLTED